MKALTRKVLSFFFHPFFFLFSSSYLPWPRFCVCCEALSKCSSFLVLKYVECPCSCIVLGFQMFPSRSPWRTSGDRSNQAKHVSNMSSFAKFIVLTQTFFSWTPSILVSSVAGQQLILPKQQILSCLSQDCFHNTVSPLWKLRDSLLCPLGRQK